MNLNKLSEDIYNANKEKGFWDNERNVGETLMLVVTELAEAMEVHRKTGDIRIHPDDKKTVEGVSEELFPSTFVMLAKDTFGDEIADALIRIFDLAGGFGIDLDFHVSQKLRYNATREYKHGKKY
jgi:NTP pyrophosphatase (non-canonical NTP hydrolase)